MGKIPAFPPDAPFEYLPSIAFQSEMERRDILARGFDKLQKGEVAEEALVFGQKYKKKIESDYAPKVSVRFVNDQVGHGVFAEQTLKSERYVGEYTGIVRENIRVYFVPLNNYCYEYPVVDSLGKHFVVDATRGNFTRFINHSFKPNLRPAYAFYDGFYHVIFLTLRQISKGEQLCFDYGHNYWILREAPQILA
ncbi:MAG TPA: SET domain-containing protein-lysine N-methyltransferase [Chlamydiales bacterium]|nr:SET domain-containing protein-lysine N-methyltransferase [Chlamydiales bacterium]